MNVKRLFELTDKQVESLTEKDLIDVNVDLNDFIKNGKLQLEIVKKFIHSIRTDQTLIQNQQNYVCDLLHAANNDIRQLKIGDQQIATFSASLNSKIRKATRVKETNNSTQLREFKTKNDELSDALDRLNLEEDRKLAEQIKRRNELKSRELAAVQKLEQNKKKKIELQKLIAASKFRRQEKLEAEKRRSEAAQRNDQKLETENSQVKSSKIPPVNSQKTHSMKQVETVENILPITPLRRTTNSRKLLTKKTDETSISVVKQKKAQWGKNEKADLAIAFRLYNPIDEKDWNLVAEVLPVNWTIEELKSQAKIMKLSPLIAASQNLSERNELVKQLKKLMQDDKIPKKGTLRREELEETITQLMFQRSQIEIDPSTNDTLDDSDSEFYQEAIRSHALDFHDNPNQYVTPSKRAFVPKPISAMRSRESLAAVEKVGDDFSLVDSCKQLRFRRQFRAQQFNRRFGHKTQINEDEENEPQESRKRSTSRSSASSPLMNDMTFDEIDEI